MVYVTGSAINGYNVGSNISITDVLISPHKILICAHLTKMMLFLVSELELRTTVVDQLLKSHM